MLKIWFLDASHILGRKPFPWTQAILSVLGRRPAGLVIDLTFGLTFSLTFGLTIFSLIIFARTDRATDRQSDGRKVETIAHFSVFDGKMW